MATMVAVCSGLGRKKLTCLLTATVYLAHPGTHMRPWGRCYKYKQVTSNENLLLSHCISPFTGCIHGRHITGLCGKKQKEITKAIKRAQIMGLMPVSYKVCISQRPQSL
ncbi:28S ribosomal protein S18c, mitochondrial-like isoform X2 [Cebus imitator]|uniref:28S ribosomal protein S18c, mitochondrial-like isoform X2 n=1 Tax=Sapajus apella TaxID=9515 RepID=A0A6J3FUX4_SAPAP|nr:28S ribosomal protein S18c, mitochondrial-like isoform X2 [Sapajus apella]XP_037595023.1 28S ribosomal protein S18c, mitochondrial-like isoform X2 [Cebus imitator]